MQSTEDSLLITGNETLNGRVAVSGSKNATFPILAGTLLLDAPVTLDNVPQITDVQTFIACMNAIGAKVDRTETSATIDPRQITDHSIPIGLGQQIRGSYYFLGSLLGRFGTATVPYPGGCNIGHRPMELHLECLKQLGCSFETNNNCIQGLSHQRNERRSETIHLPFPSRGVTINLLLFVARQAALTLTVKNANTSPETIALEHFLEQVGVRIDGIGTSTLLITGTSQLIYCGDSHPIIQDKIEAATLLLAGLVTDGVVSISTPSTRHLTTFFEILASMGVEIINHDGHTSIATMKHLSATQIIAGLGDNALDADFEPLLATVACLANGDTVIEDSINPNRHAQFLPQLESAGANVTIHSPTKATIHGPARFRAFNGCAKDIRGGVAQVLAALVAPGTTKITGVGQIDRGYVKIDSKLKAIGAIIKRL